MNAEREFAATIAAHFMTMLDEGSLDMKVPGVEGVLNDVEYDEETDEIIFVFAKEHGQRSPVGQAHTVTRFFSVRVSEPQS